MEESMNFVHFSTYDRGGAAQAAYRFHSNLIANGHDSLFFVKYKTVDDRTVLAPKKSIFSSIPKIINRLKIKVHLLASKYCFYNETMGSGSFMNFHEYIEHIPFQPDAIILHWVSEFVDLRVIKQLQQHYRVPVFWYLMDMAPMTGGCHYAWECEGYLNTCENCPAVTWPQYQSVHRMLMHKKELLDHMAVTALAPCSWVRAQLERSTLFRDKPIRDLMLAINHEVFMPGDKHAVRKKYGLNPAKKIIFFGASSFEDPRKGMRYIVEALKQLYRDHERLYEKLLIVTAGNPPAEKLIQMIGFEHKHIGFLQGEQALAEGYQLADVYVCASIEDSGPMMINEAIMCGTPVVAFDMGVASDLIIERQTGYLAELKNIDDLKRGIESIIDLTDETYSFMSKKCREVGLKKLGEANQINTFVNIVKGV